MKTRDEGFVREPSHRGAIGPDPMTSAVTIALGILPENTREVMGLRTEQTEGAKFLARGS